MSKLVVTLSLYLAAIYSAPCIPANTCFPINIGDSGSTVPGDGAFMLTCNSQGHVTKTEWVNRNLNVCDRISSGNTKTATVVNNDGSTGKDAGTIFNGVTTSGSGSGAIGSDSLMGLNCPNLGQSSNTCTDYMVIKRYGNVGWINPTNQEELPYQDIGKGTGGTLEDAQGNCGGKGEEADYFVMPIGCVTLYSAGSNLFWV